MRALPLIPKRVYRRARSASWPACTCACQGAGVNYLQAAAIYQPRTQAPAPRLHPRQLHYQQQQHAHARVRPLCLLTPCTLTCAHLCPQTFVGCKHVFFFWRCFSEVSEAASSSCFCSARTWGGGGVLQRRPPTPDLRGGDGCSSGVPVASTKLVFCALRKKMDSKNMRYLLHLSIDDSHGEQTLVCTIPIIIAFRMKRNLMKI